MGKVRTIHTCSECGQQVAQWMGRCPGCGSWGTIREQALGGRVVSGVGPLEPAPGGERRVSTGLPGVDRVLGGGLVRAGVALLAGEPGIGKSTLLLQLVSNLSDAGLSSLLASGEESSEQVGARAHRLGISGRGISFVGG